MSGTYSATELHPTPGAFSMPPFLWNIFEYSTNILNINILNINHGDNFSSSFLYAMHCYHWKSLTFSVTKIMFIVIDLYPAQFSSPQSMKIDNFHLLYHPLYLLISWLVPYLHSKIIFFGPHLAAFRTHSYC